MYKEIREKINRVIPAYTIIPLLCCFGVNCLIYYGVRILAAGKKHYDFTTAFDRAVPVIPEFVILYLGCYIFWVVNYILIARQGKEYCMRFVFADIMSRLICGVFYLFLPTTNIRPELLGNDVWTVILKAVYATDAADNLFPSIHCLVSWFCYIGIRGRKEIPKWYRGFSCIFAILVFISTQVTKQHYIIDVIGGIIIAELTFYIAFRTNWYRPLEKVFDRISYTILGKNA